MLKIRLARIGKRNEPHFRVVLADHKRAVQKKYLENLGHYHPQLKKNKLTLKTERIKYWVSKGTQLSKTVEDILYKERILDLGVRKYTPAKPKPKKKDAKKQEQASGTGTEVKAEKTEVKKEDKEKSVKDEKQSTDKKKS